VRKIRKDEIKEGPILFNVLVVREVDGSACVERLGMGQVEA
jgi:hypothetical protein